MPPATIPGPVTLRGVAAAGLGKASQFTALPWVEREFANKLGLRAWPGTFNVRLIEPRSLEVWARVIAHGGIDIEPPDASACVACCYPALVNDRVEGAIILPHVPGYPQDQIEIVAAESIRATLALREGDPVYLRLLSSLDSLDR